jgi:formylglycine-generating enzyme required for sulfatase activity
MISLRKFIGFIGCIGIVSCASKATENTIHELTFSPPITKNGMVWVPGGELTMGSDDPGAYAAERPAVKVPVA